jgi:hypothetical protein
MREVCEMRGHLKICQPSAVPAAPAPEAGPGLRLATQRGSGMAVNILAPVQPGCSAAVSGSRGAPSVLAATEGEGSAGASKAKAKSATVAAVQ